MSLAAPHPATPDPAALADEAARFLSKNPGVERLDVMLVDPNGIARGKWLPGDAVKKVFKSGVAFPYSLLGLDVWGREVPETGLHIASGDRDGIALPVPGTLALKPEAAANAAGVLLTMHDPAHVPFLGDPRNGAAVLVDRLAARGLTATVAFELEFYLLDHRGADGMPPKPVFSTHHEPVRQNMYALDDLDVLAPFLDDVRRAAEAQGIPADAAVSEAAAGQFEVNLYHRDAPLRAADDAILLRRLICGMARKHGFTATFMAKPFDDWPGNGMHIHAAFHQDAGPDKTANIFDGEAGEARLGHAVTGVLDTMDAALLAFISTFNGFRRLQPGSYAPSAKCWGHDNRSVAVRIPAERGPARRLEHRIAGADANPYLVLIGVLAGMLAGLDGEQAPPLANEGNAYERTDLPRLTHLMDEALPAFGASDFARDAFGETLHRMVAAIKAQELATFRTTVTDLERSTFL
ncbi:MAG: glutamine synthetase family protein [Pseudomonadota bacterium]